MKFSGKMCLKIILKVTKNQGFSLCLEDTLFEKPQGGVRLTHTHPPPPTTTAVKVDKKINTLCHMSSSMSLEKRRRLMKAFIKSQFNYCPLIWMLSSRAMNNKINHIHERALRTVYSAYNSSFYELLDKDDTFKIHKKNIQNLAIGIYKYLHGLSPAILSDVSRVNETIPYDLRMRNELYVRNPKIVICITETTFFLSP